MASSTTRVTLANSARKLPKGAKLVGAADPKQEIEISVRLRAKRADDEQVMTLGAQPPRERQYLSLAVALVGVERHLHRVEPAGTQRSSELSERGGRIVRYAQPVDPPSLALLVEPAGMFLPRHEIVNLLDLDAAEPFDLSPVLLTSFVHAGGPDLRRDQRSLAPSRERCP